MQFRIEWTDYETGFHQCREMEFEDTETASARVQAEDLAYHWSDKGPYKITELSAPKQKRHSPRLR